MIFLRPHHISCIYFFKGYGYSEDYVKQMKKLISFLEKNRKERIKFLIACDDICKFCPKRIGNICRDEKTVLEIDANTIKEYKLNLDKFYTFEEISERFYKNFAFSICKKVCGSCEWLNKGLCGDEGSNSCCCKY